MKSSYAIIITAVLLGLFGWFLYSKPQTEPIQNIDALSQYSSDTYGISFSYPSDYVLSEQDVFLDDTQKYHHIAMIHKKDLPLPVSGEGPTAITVDIYGNSHENSTKSNYTAETWARNSKQSNLMLGEGILATTTVSGFPAVSFRWSGLFEGTTIVLARPSHAYVFSVTYLEMGAPIVQDFVKVRDSVKVAN